jgi:hypothetical protein
MNLSIVNQCHSCGAAICQRAFTINLALGFDEEQFCINCLAAQHEQSPTDIFELGYHYVQNRDCFRKAWLKQTDPQTCPLKESCVFNICFTEN